MKVITEEQFKIIEKKVDKFNNDLWIWEVDYWDILYTYFNPWHLLNDWIECNDEYENNIVDFINETAKSIK